MLDVGVMMLSIGLMSGTSMDGIDAALLKTDGKGVIQELGHASISYEPRFKILLKSAEYAVRKSEGDLEKAKNKYSESIKDYLTNELKTSEANVNGKIIDLSSYLHGVDKSDKPITLDEVIQHSTKLHADAVKKLLKETGYKNKQIDLVGYHGQTLFHRPSKKITVQIGDGQYLANALGITVINDFRSLDVASGGQGAPFAPLYHLALATRDKKIPAVVVNCGGIGNVSVFSSTNALDLVGYDTGPGNALVDRLVRQRTSGKENMDEDGKYGSKGKVNIKVLNALYEKSIIKDGKNYFQMKPPKSLDYGDMELISELDTLSLEDACRTLEAFTADTIVNSMKFLDKQKVPKHWILAGGGWNNPVIRQELKDRLIEKFGRDMHIQTADEANWNGQALEAQIFAYLAVRSMQHLPISFPGTTQVPEPLSGGHAYIPEYQEITEAIKKSIESNPSILYGHSEQTFIG